jgi:hypothetical protein
MTVASAHPITVTRSACAALLTALLSGCGADPADIPTTTVRDSAGITVVESGSGSWATGDAWHLSEDPVLSIGEVDGPAEYAFHELRVALRLATGEIVAVNAGTNELRFYDSTGTHVRTVGGTGDGPGEYEQMLRLWRFGADSLLVSEFGGSMTVLGADGTFGRRLSLDRTTVEGFPSLVGPFDDGSLLARVWRVSEADAFREGYTLQYDAYFRYSSTGDALDSLVTRPGRENVASRYGGQFASGTPPFGRAAVTAIDGDRWYYGSSARYEIELLTARGRLLRMIRRPVQNRPVTSAIVERFREWATAQTDLPPIFRQRIMNEPFPETMPAYDRLLVDDEGNLWVGQPADPFADDESTWDVFDRDGVFLGAVSHPLRFAPTHTGSDFVLGVWRDENGVQLIRMYRLVKPSHETP